MPNLHEKDKDIASAQSKCAYTGCLSVGNTTESHVHAMSVSENLSLKMGVSPQHITNTKHFGFQFQDQDSSSTQSTGQSYPKQSVVSASSGHDETCEKLSGGHSKLTTSNGLGTQELLMCPTQFGYSQSIARIPLHYAEPYFGGVSSVYGTQSMVHNPHLMAMFTGRVPLPLNLTEEEPIYVNSKQYRAILRRRQYRAKLEAQNKLIKVRKPYLHESRHLHALNRARGSGGRFLNAKKSEDSTLTPSSNEVVSSSAASRFTGNMLRSEMHHHKNHQEAASTTSCSDVTSASSSDGMFQHQGFRFYGYPSHIGGTLQSPLENMHSSDLLHHRLALR